ncbi:NAD(P)H-binding protein [Frankia sp. AgB1.9]|uniref:NAD(P)H-binding protein n=1 Tax=unclassified Frankia TaxID=2632575 RepID=UPI0019342E25|nr:MULTISPECIES: NAD(P)H-binding protein [unclassified Frankia]MBL7491657.1 NAD(P)H-binding protein [Frankia sp. AgW1.1]MBL7551624.1 NAD(P)H-binding protein [Frankia sp. AgB1.9]MBL7624209.1 NAD(P)H-binding protein [Frankia sp. AgB1.8]
MTIAVTGGNGEFGRAVLESLPARTSEPIVGTVRDLAKVAPVPGVDYRPGDFDDPAAFQAALRGVDVALINATFFGAEPARRLARVTAALRAAADAEVSRIVLTSWSDLDNATVPAVRDYKDLEAAATSAGPAVTILRMASGLADALARDVVWGRAGGELVAPAGRAAATPAAIADLAEATAAVLTEPGHDSLVHELTGPDQVTWDQLAELAGVPFRAVNEDEYLDYLVRFALPPTVTRQLLELFADFRGTWASAPTPTLAHLVGHAPTPGTEAVARRVARFPTS